MTKSNWRSSKLVALSAVLAASAALSACHGGGGGGDPYVQPWYDVYGHRCGSGTPSAGCNFYYNGDKITDVNDPYFNTSNYNLQYATWLYTDSYGYSQYYTGWAWLSATGILYDDLGNALNEEGASESRDQISDIADIETKVVSEVGKSFAAKYALAEDNGIRIARTLNDWATLAKVKSRARTEQDVKDFSQRLYGTTAANVNKALDSAAKGDLAGLKTVNQDVAQFWGTGPETSAEILKSWYKSQLSEYGVSK